MLNAKKNTPIFLTLMIIAIMKFQKKGKFLKSKNIFYIIKKILRKIFKCYIYLIKM